MTLHSKRFQTAAELCLFINTAPIIKANIQQIASESASGGYTLFWWA